MSATSFNIVIVRGITHPSILVVFKNLVGAQVDLDSYNVYSQVRKKPGGSVVLDLEPVIIPDDQLLGYPDEVLGPGRVKLAGYTDEETFAMKNASLYWDIVLENPAGERLGPFVAGSFDIITIITEPS